MPKVLAKTIKKTTPKTNKQLSNSVKRMQEEKMSKGKMTAKYREPDLSKYGVGKAKEIGVSVPAKAPKTKISSISQSSYSSVAMPKRSTATKATKRSGKIKK